ncbi:MAG: hypothetical protein Q9207_005814 [Kuettlingeria erythrocarpa]
MSNTDRPSAGSSRSAALNGRPTRTTYTARRERQQRHPRRSASPERSPNRSVAPGGLILPPSARRPSLNGPLDAACALIENWAKTRVVGSTPDATAIRLRRESQSALEALLENDLLTALEAASIVPQVFSNRTLAYLVVQRLRIPGVMRALRQDSKFSALLGTARFAVAMVKYTTWGYLMWSGDIPEPREGDYPEYPIRIE